MILPANIMVIARNAERKFRTVRSANLLMETILQLHTIAYICAKNVTRNDMANKYNNKKVVVDGITFDSIKESQRYGELKLMEKAGTISNLIVHPKYQLQPSFKYHGETIRAIFYVADFEYFDCDKVIIEDVKGGKGTLTEAFLLKAKLLKRLLLTDPFHRHEFRIVR
jgi:hypothetical protein